MHDSHSEAFLNKSIKEIEILLGFPVTILLNSHYKLTFCASSTYEDAFSKTEAIYATTIPVQIDPFYE
jgi:hypothetical protein